MPDYLLPAPVREMLAAVPGGIIILAGSLLMAVAFAFLTGQLIKRRPAGSWAAMFAREGRLPLVLLTLFLGGKEGFEQLVPDDWLAGLDSLTFFESLPITIAISWFILRCISRIEDALEKGGPATLKLPQFLDKLSHRDMQLLLVFVRVTGAMLIILLLLNAAGVSIAGLLAFGGAGGLVIGFAAREILSDIIAGFLVVWTDEFEVGEWIKLRGTDIEGTIESYDLRYTLIRTFDRRPLYVPNSIIIKHVIENPDRMTHRRIFEYAGLRYCDIGRLPKVLADIRQMLTDHPGIDSNQIQLVAFDRFGASAVEFYVYCMTSTTKWAAAVACKEDVLFKIAAIVEKNGAEFAFPTSTVHVDSLPEQSVAASAPGRPSDN